MTLSKKIFIKQCTDNKIPLPYGLTRECLMTSNEECVSASMLTNKARYHKNCRNSIRNQAVRRELSKRRISDEYSSFDDNC